MASPDNSIKNNGAHISQFKTNFTNQEAAQIAVSSGTAYNPKSVNASIEGTLQVGSRNIVNKRQIAATVGSSMLNAGVTQKNTADFLSSIMDERNKNDLNLNSATNNYKKSLVNPYEKAKRMPGQDPYRKIKSSKESIVGISDYAYEGLMFPKDLEKKAPAYISLDFYKYKRPGPLAEGTTSKLDTVSLPMPANLSQVYNIRLDQKDTGFYGDIVNNLSEISTNFSEDIQKGNFTDRLMSTGGDLLKGAGLRGLMMGGDAVDVVASGPAGADQGSISGIITQFMGAVPNPHASVFFKGMDLRQFTWTWKLVPRSSDESETLKKILNFIKRKVLPRAGGSTLDYPDMIQPRIEGGSNKEVMGDFQMCMCKNLTINFTPEGGSAFFFDGAPVSVELTMEFQEIIIQTSSDGAESGGSKVTTEGSVEEAYNAAGQPPPDPDPDTQGGD
jgi:hypothetical protein